MLYGCFDFGTNHVPCTVSPTLLNRVSIHSHVDVQHSSRACNLAPGRLGHRLGESKQKHTVSVGASSHAAGTETEVFLSAFSTLQERGDLLNANKKEMGDLFERRSRMEADFMERFLAAVENYQGVLEALRIADAEDYHILKIR